MKPLYVFIHMTKTAGGSLRYAIENLNRPDVECTNGVSNVEAIDAKRMSQIKLLFGHLRYGLNLQTERQIMYLTYLRHPITRVVSHYHHLFSVDKSHIGDKIREHTDINGFFKNSQHWEFSNFMTKIITNTVNKKMTDLERFELAKSIIQRDYAFVGIQETFDLCLISLNHLLDMNIKVEKSYNVGSWSISELDRDTLDKIIKANQADLMLYRYAVQEMLEKQSSFQSLVNYDVG